MKKLRFLLLFFIGLTILSSCDNQILNQQPEDEITEEQLWNDVALMEAFVNNIYSGIGHGFTSISISSGVDETKHVHGWDDQQVRMSNMTPDDLGFWEGWWGDFQWDEIYSQIRNINIFLANVDESPVDQEIKDRLTGEVYFLRAFYYHRLIKVFGGVPLIDKVYNLGDEDFLVERSTFEESVDFVVSDLDRAASYLPVVIEGDKSRATKGAALALKSRILLFSASDLYTNPQGEHPELTGYTSGDQMQRWRSAKQAAEETMALGYGLYAANPAQGDSTAENYAGIFLQDDHQEIVFARYFVRGQEWDGCCGNALAMTPDIGLYHGPNGYHNWGGDVPLQQMVDAYEMANGTKFDWNNSQHAAYPYENRDPRFYASIFYNGSHWRERPGDMIDQDPEGIVETAYFEMEGQQDLRPGIDTRDGPVEDWNGTYTGYYMRKFLDINVDHQFYMQTKPYIFIRFGEVLLNYAEASIELGEEEDARIALNRIRERAGMPGITDSGQALMERYRNERRVELAFEGHRYFDVRRWMIAPQVYEDGRGVNIIGRLNSDDSYTFEYSVQVVDQREWKDNAYFLPIPRYEIDKNENLIQNPGYN